MHVNFHSQIFSEAKQNIKRTFRKQNPNRSAAENTRGGNFILFFKKKPNFFNPKFLPKTNYRF